MTKTLIRGGTVLSMDRRIGDLAKGDVLIEGERIAKVATAIRRSARRTRGRSGRKPAT